MDEILYERLIQELDASLAKKIYLTGNDLIKIGLFGSHSAIDSALKRGDLPYVKISSRRRVFPRSAVLEYFKNNIGVGLK